MRIRFRAGSSLPVFGKIVLTSPYQVNMTKDRLLWIVIFALAAGLAVLLFQLAGRDPGALAGEAGRPGIVHSLVLLVILVASAVLHRRMRPGHILRHLSAWLAIGTVLVLGYSFRYDAANLGERLWAEVMPSRGMVADGVITFRESRGGHFIVDADVDGVSIPFLVDTGASDVTLKPSDARRLGFDLDGLSYDRTYRTANGTVRGASVRLRRVTIGPISVTQVRASVNAAEMTRSLLGMSFLSRLSGFEVAQGRLTLRP